MNSTTRFVNRLLLHRLLAWVQLTLVAYALVYSGIHQFNNPAVLVEDCILVTHHLHQNPDTHQCDLCDYHLRFHVLDTRVDLTPALHQKTLVIKEIVEPVVELADNTSTRGPPIS